MRTDVSTFIALNAIFGYPFRYKGADTSLFVPGCSRHPGAVFDAFEGRNRKQVAVLCIDGTNYFVDKFGIVVDYRGVVRQISPGRINFELFVFTTSVDGFVVFPDNLFAFITVGLDNEFLHLINSQIHIYNLGYSEESRLQYGVGTIAEAYLLCYLGGVDIINTDVPFGKITFDLGG